MPLSRIITPARIAGLAVGVAAIAIFAAERRRPLRRQKHDTTARSLRNAALGAGCAAVIALAETPATQAVARANQRHRRGIAGLFPRRLRPFVAFAVMDYGFYLWHIATHRVPFLSRFHRVHHIDPDMDMSTAVRFHPLDMLVSLPWRLVQVRVSGATPRTLEMWQRFFTLSILFHHSNLRLPRKWETRLSRLVTTPRMHGIHHSAVQDQRDSNYSSGISVWDHLHGSFRAQPEQANITIGVDDPDAMADVPIAPALLAPFTRF